MNSENSKTSDPHRLLLNLLNKTNLKTKYIYIYMLLYQTSAFTVNGKTKNSHKNNNEEFELPIGS